VADLPLLAATHVAPVLEAWRQRPDGIEAMMPLVGGVRGHPVLLSWQAVSRIVRSEERRVGEEGGTRGSELPWLQSARRPGLAAACVFFFTQRTAYELFT